MKKSLVIAILSVVCLYVIPCRAAEPVVAESPAYETVEKAWASYNGGDLDTALKQFQQATVLDPKFAPGYYGMAYVYSVQNRLDLAIVNYRKTIALADPPYTHAYGNLGLALLMSGQNKEGLAMVQKALVIDPTNGDAHLTLANYYCSEKNGKLAWEHLKKGQKLGVQADPRLLEEMKKECPEPKAKTGGQ